MIYHVLDNQFNGLTVIDTEADDGIVIDHDIHTVGLTNGTLLNTLAMDVMKNTGPRLSSWDPNSPFETSYIKEGTYIVFADENSQTVCVSVRAIEQEDEEIRPISAVDIGLELRNGSATRFENKSKQFIEYFVDRELYDTGWAIGLNEIGPDFKAYVDTTADETPLARLQKVCEAFDCEMTFTVDFQNLKVRKKLVNIYRRIGAEKTGKVLYSGVDVISMRKSVDIDNVITAIEDPRQGFNDLVEDDGRFFTRKGESIVYDRVSNSLYGRGHTWKEKDSGWITGRHESIKTTPFDNFAELRNILEVRSEPTFSAEVDMLFNDADFNIGDWLTFVDEEYNPPLRIRSRVLTKNLNRSHPEENTAEIGNYQLLNSLISSDLTALQNQLNRPRSSYAIKIMPDKATQFIDGIAETVTITAVVYENGQDISSTIQPDDLMWLKIDGNGVHDTVWEAANEKAGLTVTLSDVSVIETSSIRCALTKFDNYFVQAIYFLNGLKDVARRVLRLQTPNTVTSIHISDTHYCTDSIGRDDIDHFIRSDTHLKNAAELTHHLDIDYLVLNGDTHDGSTGNKDIAVANYKKCLSLIGMANCPYFCTWGNHDNNSFGDGRTSSINKVVKNYHPKETLTKLHGKLKQIISNEENYEVATRPSTIFGIVENPEDKMGYYYYDVPEKNHRVIILNAQDIPQILDEDGYAKYLALYVAGYRQKQITWLYQTLKSTPANVSVSVYQHHTFGNKYSTSLIYYPYNHEFVEGLLNAFVSGGKFSRTYSANSDFSCTLSADFEGKIGTVAYLAHGHAHVDKITKDSYGIVNYSIGASCCRPKKDIADRPWGVLEEDLWDVVIHNTKTRRVDLIRYGYGPDRSFTY